MVAVRPAEIDAFVQRPDPARPIALVYGPDAGLVAERAAALVRAAVDDPTDPFALARLDGDQLAADPSRLLDEAHTVPLFAGRRAIWVKAGGRDFTAAVEGLLGTGMRDCRVVIEAGDLRRTAPLRALGERAPEIAALACYVDTERDLARLVEEELRAADLSIAPDARAALLPLLGGDRRASRNELRKLALYARGRPRVELDDVVAVVADASALVLDNTIDAAFAGRAADVEASFSRVREAGVAMARILAVAVSHAGQLHRARLAVEDGASVPEAAQQIISRAQFRRKSAVEAALRMWTAARLERAIGSLAEAALDARRLSGAAAQLVDPMASQALLRVAHAARRTK